MNFERIRLNKMIGKLKKVLRIGYKTQYICPICNSVMRYDGYYGEYNQENAVQFGSLYICKDCDFHYYKDSKTYFLRDEILDKYGINELSETYQRVYSDNENKMNLVKKLRKV